MPRLKVIYEKLKSVYLTFKGSVLLLISLKKTADWIALLLTPYVACPPSKMSQFICYLLRLSGYETITGRRESLILPFI